jgi:hypothetical protein
MPSLDHSSPARGAAADDSRAASPTTCCVTPPSTSPPPSSPQPAAAVGVFWDVCSCAPARPLDDDAAAADSADPLRFARGARALCAYARASFGDGPLECCTYAPAGALTDAQAEALERLDEVSESCGGELMLPADALALKLAIDLSLFHGAAPAGAAKSLVLCRRRRHARRRPAAPQLAPRRRPADAGLAARRGRAR